MRGVTYRSIYNYRSILQFLLTRLMRGVTRSAAATIGRLQFLLTRLMRGVTLLKINFSFLFSFLLTRLMRGVTGCLLQRERYRFNFYSHASCEA